MGKRRNDGLSDFCLVFFALGGLVFLLLCLGEWSPFIVTPPAFEWFEQVAPSDYSWVYDKLFDGVVFGLALLAVASILFLILIVLIFTINYLKGEWSFREPMDD